MIPNGLTLLLEKNGLSMPALMSLYQYKDLLISDLTPEKLVEIGSKLGFHKLTSSVATDFITTWKSNSSDTLAEFISDPKRVGALVDVLNRSEVEHTIAQQATELHQCPNCKMVSVL